MELFSSVAESVTLCRRQLNIRCGREKECKDDSCHDHSTHTEDAGVTTYSDIPSFLSESRIHSIHSMTLF